MKEVFKIPQKKKKIRKAVKTVRVRGPVDEIMKFLFGVSKETLINMLNSLFKKDFSVDNATITQTNSEFVDEAFDITRGDLFFRIVDESKPYNLHIEIQTRADGYMTIRLINYDIKKADEIQRLENKKGIKRYVLPQSIVIHVEKSDSIPDCYESEIVDVKADGSEETIHRVVPVIKYWELTDKDLIEQKLYPLLPLQIFLLRGKLKKFAKETGSEDKRKVVDEIKGLTEKTITEVKWLATEGKITKDDDDRIITALARLIKYLDEQYQFGENLNQEVDTVIESVFTQLERKGRERGIEENKLEVAEKMILKNKPLDEIIEFSELAEDKIRQLAKKLSKEIVL